MAEVKKFYSTLKRDAAEELGLLPQISDSDSMIMASLEDLKPYTETKLCTNSLKAY